MKLKAVRHSIAPSLQLLVASSSARSTMRPRPASEATVDSRVRLLYSTVLTWAFTLFGSVRVLSYVPTIWALAHSSDTSQHSLWTWGTWFGANLTMSLWLIERNGNRLDRAASVNLGNALMCLAVVVLIVVKRL